MTTPFQFTGTIKAAADQPRRLAIVGYSGSPMKVGGFRTPILIDLSGMDLPANVTVLADHDSTIAGVVGSAIPKVVGGQLLFSATCADTEAANSVLSILESGVQLQASVGAEVVESKFIDRGSVKANGRLWQVPESGIEHVTISRLREITICPLGADANTSVSIAARSAKGKTMVKQMLKASGRFTDDDIDAMTEDEAKAALKRLSKMVNPDDDDDDDDKADAAMMADILTGDHLPRGIFVTALKERWDMTTARNVSLAYLRSSRPGAGVGVRPGGHGQRFAGAGSAEEALAPYVGALLAKMGSESWAEAKLGAHAMEASRQFHRSSTMSILSASLYARGIDHDPGDAQMMIRADGASSVNVPSLLANVLGKSLEMQWQAQPATWRSWTAQKSAKDFKAQSAVRPSVSGTLTQLHPSGQIEHASITDWAVAWQVLTFSKMLTIPRNLIVNDDLGGFAEIPASFAQMSERALADMVYATLLANPSSFFHVDNNNIQTSGSSALSASSLATAFRQMRKQTAPNGSPLNLQPAVLVVAPSLEQTARALLNSQFVWRNVSSTDNLPSGNPLQGSCALEVEARLELGCTSPVTGSTAQTGSATKWFVAAAPAALPAIVGFLGTGQGPIIETAGPDHNFSNPGLSIRCLLDAGFSLGDYRAMQYSAGA